MPTKGRQKSSDKHIIIPITTCRRHERESTCSRTLSNWYHLYHYHWHGRLWKVCNDLLLHREYFEISIGSIFHRQRTDKWTSRTNQFDKTKIGTLLKSIAFLKDFIKLQDLFQKLRDIHLWKGTISTQRDKLTSQRGLQPSQYLTALF